MPHDFCFILGKMKKLAGLHSNRFLHAPTCQGGRPTQEADLPKRQALLQIRCLQLQNILL